MSTRVFYLVIITCIAFATQAVAQLQITNHPASYYVNSVLLGPGVVVKNIKFTGDTAAIGEFVNKGNKLALDHGLVLSTGKVLSAIGPNATKLAPGDGNNQPGDRDLDKLLTKSRRTFDAVILEFDFFPSTNSISFSYVFASEEYPEFVNKDYNDVFAFFVSGPGVTDTNLAIVPGTASPVSVNSINATKNASLYIENPVDAGVTTEVSYNGFTKVLKAELSNLQFCKAYHIKMAIQDVNDLTFDSAIFLKANSFVSGTAALPVVSPYTKNGSDIVAEGCGSGGFVITKAGSGQETINFELSGDAVLGQDYDLLSGNTTTSITIPANKKSDTVFFKASADALSENIETISLSVLNTNTCLKPTAQVQIFDLEPIVANIRKPQCEGTAWKLIAYAINGSYNYTCAWYDKNNNKLSDQCDLTVNPTNANESFRVEIKDACTGEIVKKEATLSPVQAISIGADFVDTLICKGSAVKLKTSASQSDLIYSWSPTIFLDDPTSATPIATPDRSITYTLTIANPNYCAPPLDVLVDVFSANLSQDTMGICKGAKVQLKAKGGSTYNWMPTNDITNPTIANPIVNPRSSQYYRVKVFNQQLNCSATDSVYVKVDVPIIPTMGPDLTVCKRSTVKLQAPPAEFYEWTPINSLDFPDSPTPLANPFVTTLYKVSLFNGACKVNGSITVNVINEPNTDFTLNVNPCIKEVELSNKSTNTLGAYKWYFGDGDSTKLEDPYRHTYKKAGDYTITLVSNAETPLCSDTLRQKVQMEDIDSSKLFIPNVFTPNGDALNDVFTITGGLSTCLAEAMDVYNRWGTAIFSTEDKTKFYWDGTIEGKPAPDGVYYYIIKGKGYYKGGSVTLMR